MSNKNLDVYQNKRDFSKTPEPKPLKKAAYHKSTEKFVVQKHDASHLHYDFRLEVDGVLVSWAIPKGPSLDHMQKRLAIQTEDHPLDYAHFEGIIPEGNYGAGTVMVWDLGTYQNLKNHSMKQSLKEGKIEIFLNGKKLKGAFALIRRSMQDGKDQWLFFKMKDDYEKPGSDVTKQAKSALSGKTMKQIAQSKKAFGH